MMVADASVVYKWIIYENDSTTAAALKLREEFLVGKLKVISPDIIIYELANILSFKANLSISDIKKAWNSFTKLNLSIINPSLDFIYKCTNFSKRYRVSVYDASYAVLAKEKGSDLVTADDKFVKLVNLPFIKHLSQI